MKISIIIPAHNEADRIKKVVNGLRKYKLNTIVVDDGSSDKTVNVLSRLIVKNRKLSILRHRVNLGKGAAMKTGAEFAFGSGANAVIFIDSDGQHDLDDLPEFIERLKKGDSFIIGSRNLGYGVPIIRYLGNKFASILVAVLFGIYVSDLLCGYRAITKDVYEKIVWKSVGYGVETEMIVNAAKRKIKVTEIPIKTVYIDSVKGVTILDAINILVDVLFWRIQK